MLRYLAYGSNLHPGRLRIRAPSAQEIGTVSLPGWLIRFHKRSTKDGSAKANMVQTASSSNLVYGAVFTMLESDKEVLDEYEGLGNGYDQHELDLPGYGRVITYLAADTHIDENLKPFVWYKNLILSGAMFHGFPMRYVDMLSNIPAIDDPDPARRNGNQAILNSFIDEFGL